MYVRQAALLFFDGETNKAAGLARQSETRVGSTLSPTPIKHSVRLICVALVCVCICVASLALEKASFLRDSEEGHL